MNNFLHYCWKYLLVPRDFLLVLQVPTDLQFKEKNNMGFLRFSMLERKIWRPGRVILNIIIIANKAEVRYKSLTKTSFQYLLLCSNSSFSHKIMNKQVFNFNSVVYKTKKLWILQTNINTCKVSKLNKQNINLMKSMKKIV